MNHTMIDISDTKLQKRRRSSGYQQRYNEAKFILSDKRRSPSVSLYDCHEHIRQRPSSNCLAQPIISKTSLKVSKLTNRER